MSSLAAPELVTSDQPEPRYSRWRLVLGVVARTWLWFIVGCLLVTLVPILIGWRPYVIDSGSMSPRIKVGDVILVSPEKDPQKLLGHVATFDDPGFPGKVKSHRVIAINKDGTLKTKGDANAQPDSDPVPISTVHGIGRLLVRWVGLPMIWMQHGAWLRLLAFLATLVLAGWAVARDFEPDEPEDGDGDDEGSGPAAAGVPGPLIDWVSPTQVAAARPFRLPKWPARLAGGSFRAVLLRTSFLAVASLLLVLPTTMAAFAATSKNTGNSWAAPKYDYTTQVNALGPYLYWKLDETGTTNTVATDSSGNSRTGTYNASNASGTTWTANAGATYYTRGVTGALVDSSTNNAVTIVSKQSCINTTSTTLINGQTPVSVVVWFKVANGYTGGGKIAGFEKPQVGVAVPSTGTYDRHLYMDGNGHVWFGVYNNGFYTVQSANALNDGNWHMAVGTVGPSGTKLYIDGVLQGTSANTAGESSTGVWRVGCGNLAGWGGSWNGPNNPGTSTSTTANMPFLGSVDEFSVFASELTAAQISFLYFTR